MKNLIALATLISELKQEKLHTVEIVDGRIFLYSKPEKNKFTVIGLSENMFYMNSVVKYTYKMDDVWYHSYPNSKHHYKFTEEELLETLRNWNWIK